MIFLAICKLAESLRIERLLWREGLATKFGFFTKHPKNIRSAEFQEISANTFFRVLKLILTDQSPAEFKGKPYLLILNPNDNRVNYRYIEMQAKALCNKYLILTTTLEHFPKDLDSTTLNNGLDATKLEKGLKFLSQHDKSM